MFLDSQKLSQQLLDAGGTSSAPLLIHTDLLKVGLIEKMKKPEDFLTDHYFLFEKLSQIRPLLFPCFNYDFAKTGLLDLANSPSQVGAFPDYLRRKGLPRTPTPIFSLMVLGKVQPEWMKIPKNLFGMDSLFYHLRSLNADVLFWGAPFSSNTFFHLVEEDLQVGYRYLKTFPGKVISASAETACQVLFRVRPKGLDPFSYNWDLQAEDLKAAGILKNFPAGNTQALLFNSQKFSDFLSQKLKRELLRYLAPVTQSLIEKTKQEKKYPFQFSDFE